MICPYCNKEMKKGTINGDGGSKIYWKNENQKRCIGDIVYGVGCITVANYTLTSFKIEAHFCSDCKKMIIDTDIKK